MREIQAEMQIICVKILIEQSPMPPALACLNVVTLKPCLFVQPQKIVKMIPNHDRQRNNKLTN